MYDTNMIKDFENKFQTAGLAELFEDKNLDMASHQGGICTSSLMI